jgi:thiamine pyrophosphokinase
MYSNNNTRNTRGWELTDQGCREKAQKGEVLSNVIVGDVDSLTAEGLNESTLFGVRVPKGLGESTCVCPTENE